MANSGIVLEVGVAKHRAHFFWSKTLYISTRQHRKVSRATVRVITFGQYWPCAEGLSAVNATGTHWLEPVNSGLTRWRLTVSMLHHRRKRQEENETASKHQSQPERGDSERDEREKEQPNLQ